MLPKPGAGCSQEAWGALLCGRHFVHFPRGVRPGWEYVQHFEITQEQGCRGGRAPRGRGVHGEQGGSREGLVDAGADSVGSCAAPTVGRWAHRQRLPPLPLPGNQGRLVVEDSSRNEASRSGPVAAARAASGLGCLYRGLGGGCTNVPAGGFQMGDTSWSEAGGPRSGCLCGRVCRGRPLAVVPHGRRGQGIPCVP